MWFNTHGSQSFLLEGLQPIYDYLLQAVIILYSFKNDFPGLGD
jgi:hypothetical protein